eukprot:2177501-Pyramimonas_sp.AAC.1
MTVVFGDTLSSASTVPLQTIAPPAARSLATCSGSTSALATASSTKAQSPAQVQFWLALVANFPPWALRATMGR